MKKKIIVILMVMSMGFQARGVVPLTENQKYELKRAVINNVDPSAALGNVINGKNINAHIDSDKTLLDYAAQSGNTSVLRYLYNKYPDIKMGNAAKLAAENGKLAVLKVLNTHGDLGADAQKIAVLKAAINAPIVNHKVVKWLSKTVGAKVDESVMKAARNNAAVSKKTLKVLNRHVDKGTDAKATAVKK